MWSIKSIRMLNRESQVIYFEPKSDAVDFEKLLQSLSNLWPKFTKHRRKLLKKKKFCFKLLIVTLCN